MYTGPRGRGSGSGSANTAKVVQWLASVAKVEVERWQRLVVGEGQGAGAGSGSGSGSGLAERAQGLGLVTVDAAAVVGKSKLLLSHREEGTREAALQLCVCAVMLDLLQAWGAERLGPASASGSGSGGTYLSYLRSLLLRIKRADGASPTSAAAAAKVDTQGGSDKPSSASGHATPESVFLRTLSPGLATVLQEVSRASPRVGERFLLAAIKALQGSLQAMDAAALRTDRPDRPGSPRASVGEWGSGGGGGGGGHVENSSCSSSGVVGGGGVNKGTSPAYPDKLPGASSSFGSTASTSSTASTATVSSTSSSGGGSMGRGTSGGVGGVAFDRTESDSPKPNPDPSPTSPCPRPGSGRAESVPATHASPSSSSSSIADTFFEAKLVLRIAPTTDTAWNQLARGTREFPEFVQGLTTGAKEIAITRGALLQLILPFNEGTSSSDQASTAAAMTVAGASMSNRYHVSSGVGIRSNIGNNDTCYGSGMEAVAGKSVGLVTGLGASTLARLGLARVDRLREQAVDVR